MREENQIREKGGGIESKLTEEYTPLPNSTNLPKFRPIYPFFFQFWRCARTFYGGRNSKVKIGGWQRSRRI